MSNKGYDIDSMPLNREKNLEVNGFGDGTQVKEWGHNQRCSPRVLNRIYEAKFLSVKCARPYDIP